MDEAPDREPDEGQLDDAEANRRRDEGLRQMLNTPPQPRKKKGREPEPAPKSHR